MQVQALSWNLADGWSPNRLDRDSDLVLYFGTRSVLEDGTRFAELRAKFPAAHLVGCSTGGQIRDDSITDDDVAAVSVRFGATKLRVTQASVSGQHDSHRCGEAIGAALLADDLAGIFVLSDGLHVNGSELVTGIAAAAGPGVPLTGGLAGDDARFERTLVGADCAPVQGNIAAIGFYGNALRFGHGSAGGWDEFGPRRRVTRSQGNILFELDGEPALGLYERYLGEEAQGLPGSALLFPLLIRDPARPDSDVVRTILAIDRRDRSMTFAGDVPQGGTAQLMRGNFYRLAEGAAAAARQARSALEWGGSSGGLAICVSCIGRRLLMGQRTVEEIEAAGLEIGGGTPRIGFYSYGEISPHRASGVCQLHNQTMTITTISEKA